MENRPKANQKNVNSDIDISRYEEDMYHYSQPERKRSWNITPYSPYEDPNRMQDSWGNQLAWNE